MGPGFHAKIEAVRFSAKYPHVSFLDQPTGVGFAELIGWAENAIREQHKISQRPLSLLGHSFGAQVIAHTLPRVADIVCEVRLLNSAFDSFDCFAHLEMTLLPATARGPQYWKTQSVEAKMNMIFQLVQSPGFAAAYWCNSAAQAEYEKMAESFPALDVNSFVEVFTDYLQMQVSPLKNNWPGKVEIFYSPGDNLIHSLETVAGWTSFFPKAQFREIPRVGHYGLFESSELAENFFQR